jgi:hypothetical protein
MWPDPEIGWVLSRRHAESHTRTQHFLRNISMISLVRGGGRLPLKALALALGIWAFSTPSAKADGGGGEFDGMGHTGGSGYGTLGFGGYGLYPGFQGFGLSYHRGYGYGGHALGVGANGGYPYYGGPGYPHVEPRLRRFGKITPFPYYGGPGYPCYGSPNYFGGVGPLVVDPPVASVGDRGELGYAGDYGPFTGAPPYPDTLFAPSADADATTGASRGASPPYSSTPAASNAPAAGPSR